MSKMLTKMQVLIIKRYTSYEINKEKLRGFFLEFDQKSVFGLDYRANVNR